MAKNYTADAVIGRVFMVTSIGCVLFIGAVVIFVL